MRAPHLSRTLCAGVFASLLAAPLPGLDPDRRLSQLQQRWWSVEDGLPQSTVAAIAETPDGYLWWGTTEGLARFDGSRIRTFDSESGIPSEQTEALAVDSRGVLWVGTETGLFHGGPERFEAVLHGGRSVGRVDVVARRPSGGLWVGLRRGALLETGEGASLREAVDRQGRTLSSVGAATEVAGRWIFSTRDGLFTREDDLWIELPRPGTPTIPITALAARGETLLIGTADDGLFASEGRGFRALTGPLQVAGVLVDRASDVWVGTYPGGIARIRDGRTERQLVDQSVRTLFEDSSGNVWVGTNSQGVVRLSSPPVTLWGRKEGLGSDAQLSVFQDSRGDVWIGGEGGGLARLRKGRDLETWSEADGLPNPDVLSLAEDSEGRVLVGTGNGLAWIDGDRVRSLSSSRAPVLGLLPDSRGDLWVASTAGVLLREDGDLHPIPGTRTTVALAESPDGRVFAATLAGLDVFEGSSPSRVPGTDGTTLLALLADGEDLWIGSQGRGLGRLRGSEVRWLSRGEGLCDQDVFSILAHRDRLWMSSNRGIFHVEREEARRVLEGDLPSLDCSALDADDGLRVPEASGGSQPAGWVARDGRLWFPTVRGAAVVDVDALLSRPETPVARVERVLAGRALRLDAVTSPIRLEPERRDLEIEYTAVDLGRAHDLAFRTRLTGLEDEWKAAGPRRSAVYSRLPPGRYRFEVQARLPGGAWSPPARSPDLLLTPRFHETFAARGLGALGVLLGLAGLVHLRLARMRRRQSELEEAVRERTHELEEARRALLEANETLQLRVRDGVEALRRTDRMAAYGHMVAGVAHELRHPVASLQCLVHVLSRRISPDPEADSEVVLLARETTRIRRLLDDLLELARPARPRLVATDVSELVSAAVDSHRAVHAGTEGSLPVVVEVGDDLPTVEAEPERIVQALVNLLGNAERHAAGATRILVRTRRTEGDSVEIEVVDDGCGVADSIRSTLRHPFVRAGDHAGTGLGLSIVEKTITAHGGRLDVDSDREGTKVTLTLPASDQPRA